MKSRLICPHCKNFFRNFLSHTPPSPLTSFQGSRGFCRAVLFHANKEHYKKELLHVAPCSRRLEEMGAIENGTHREHPRDKGAPLTLPCFPPGPRFFLRSFYLQAPATYDVYKNLRVQMSHSHPRTVLILVLKTAEFM